MQTNPAVEQNKNIRWLRVRGISLVGKVKVYGGKDLLKSQVLISERNTEREREDASGDSKDDELPCVMGESAGDLCLTRLAKISREQCSISKRAISDFQRGAGRLSLIHI